MRLLHSAAVSFRFLNCTADTSIHEVMIGSNGPRSRFARVLKQHVQLVLYSRHSLSSGVQSFAKRFLKTPPLHGLIRVSHPFVESEKGLTQQSTTFNDS